MSRKVERFLLIWFDFLTINTAFAVYFWFRLRGQTPESEFWVAMAIVYVYWLVWFAFFGLYRHWYAQSRLDEVLTLFRTTAIGALVLFVLVLIDDQAFEPRREWILAYWVILFGFVTTGRLGIRALQKRLLEAGVGARNTLIVGLSDKARDLYRMVVKYPALGYKVVGFVGIPDGRRGKQKGAKSVMGIPLVGTVGELPTLIEQHEIGEVLIGLDSTEHDRLLEIIRFCNGHDVGMKIMPDLYDIVSGQARINSIYGFPLIEVMPELMRPWEEAMKRVMDIVVAGGILLVGAPLWLLVAGMIKIDSRGPVLYAQQRVGRNGKIFTMYKFRSMNTDAEEESGPKWAERNDPRVTRIGKIIRRLHFDEVPQLLNVLLGDMSLVGPRPERPFFVKRLEKELPMYRRRLRVRPGMTGWAQIKYRYDQSIEDVKSKLRYDLFYIENMSWRMDLKILFNTLYVMLRGRGHA